MVPDAKQTGSKATRYLIGASILMLALILFSELSCSLLGLCKNWFPPAELVGFWEMMGISAAFLFAGLSIRTLRQPKEIEQEESNPYSTPGNNDSFAAHPEQEPCPGQGQAQKNTSRWKALFNQLSEEEKQKLKVMMEKHCGDKDVQPEGTSGHSNAS